MPYRQACLYCSDALGEMTETAAKLRTNALAESNAYKTFTGAFFTGVSAVFICYGFLQGSLCTGC